MRAGAVASFRTYTEAGEQTQSYGVTTQGYNYGVTRVEPVSDPSAIYNFSFYGAFDVTFDLWVEADRVNLITLRTMNLLVLDQYASATGYNYDGQPAGQERAFTTAFVDPVITIDEAFADRYQLVQAFIPALDTHAVPEPGTLALVFGAGVAALLVGSRRRAHHSHGAHNR